MPTRGIALVDSHAHLDSPRYDADRDELLQRAWQQGVRTILSIGIGDGPETMHQALDLSRRYAGKPETPRILATAGIHPHEAQLADKAALNKLEQMLTSPDVLAVGEIGLDYYYDHSPREQQKQAFAQQMEIAAAARRPIIIHCRPSEGSTNAWDDTLEMIESKWAGSGLGGILHCFTGDWDHARRAMDCGFLISFAGNITFPRAENIRQVAGKVPLDRALIETDAPFLAPLPYRGKRNEPGWVSRVAEKLGEVWGIPPEQVASSTANNFFRFFGVTPDPDPQLQGQQERLRA
ncbi:MAG TPA: TatD family hydrolase [Acidobacteriaceae bacterium]|nr:TatD family hydrolase [Acidobacteriaceae bacterium]